MQSIEQQLTGESKIRPISFKCSCKREWVWCRGFDKVNEKPGKEYNKKHECSNLIVYQEKKGIKRLFVHKKNGNNKTTKLF